MTDKTFIVTHPKARSPITVTGKTLAEALEKEGLIPSLWKEVEAQSEMEVEEAGKTTEDAEPQDN